MAKRVLGMISVVILISSILAGCSSRKEKAAQQQPTPLLKDNAYSSNLKKNEGYFKVTEMGNLEMYIKGDTTQLSIRNRDTDVEWKSAPNDSSSEQLLYQLKITFINSKNQTSTMNSYTDSVLLNQYVFEEIENGIKITYDIGKRKKVFIIPKVISKARFQSEILGKLDTVDQNFISGFYTEHSLDTISSQVVRDEMEKKYPSIKNGAIFVVTENLAEFAATKLEAAVLKSGYTKEDMAADHEANSVENSEESLSFRIPMAYKLEEGAFTASVLSDEIIVPEDAYLVSLDILSGFGAGSKSDEGYIFVPDGSGAVINFNNGKTGYGGYKKSVYGSDVVATAKNEALTRNIMLPVFGIKKGDNAFLAIIEKGDAIASISASVSGAETDYNTCYASFRFNHTENSSVPYHMATDMSFYPKEMTRTPIEVKYIFLTKEQNDYSGMAKRYRDYLQAKKILSSDKTTEDFSLNLSLIGAVSYDDSILGIPVKSVRALTTFAQAQEIVETLYKNQVSNLSIVYRGWANGGVYNTAMNKIKLQNQLGNAKDIQNLQTLLSENKSKIFWDIDVQNAFQTALFDGYNSGSDSPMTIMGKAARRPMVSFVGADLKIGSGLVAPSKIGGYSEAIKKYADKNSLEGLAVAELGSLLYSDFSEKNFVHRQKSLELSQQALNTLSSGKKIVASQPAAYALQYLSGALNLPSESSGHYIFDYDVPFAQMVYHGFIPYSGEPMNYENDFSTAVLKHIETGTMPSFEWMYEENIALSDIATSFTGISYKQCLNQAVDAYQTIHTVLSPLNKSCIVKHEKRNNNVVKTVYEDGTAVYVNYANETAVVDGVTINAMSYALGREIEN